MDARIFGTFIAGQRRQKGMTQAGLAEKLNVTDKAVSRWERGIGFPDICTIGPLADVLGMSVMEIMKAEKIKEEGCTFSVRYGYFRPGVMKLGADALLALPEEMFKHIRGGGTLWQVKEEKDGKAAVSTTKSGDGLCADVDASQIIEKMRKMTDKEAIAALPGPIKEHVENGGDLFVIGRPKNGRITISTGSGPGGYTIQAAVVYESDRIGSDPIRIGRVLDYCYRAIRSTRLSDEARMDAGRTMFNYLKHCMTLKELDSLTAVYRDREADNIIGYDPAAVSEFLQSMAQAYFPKEELGSNPVEICKVLDKCYKELESEGLTSDERLKIGTLIYDYLSWCLGMEELDNLTDIYRELADCNVTGYDMEAVGLFIEKLKEYVKGPDASGSPRQAP